MVRKSGVRGVSGVEERSPRRGRDVRMEPDTLRSVVGVDMAGGAGAEAHTLTGGSSSGSSTGLA